MLDWNKTSQTELKRNMQRYEKEHNRLLLLQLVGTILFLLIYFFSGASANMAKGLYAAFPKAWGWAHVCYIVITFIGYSAFLYPLFYYNDFVLERKYNLTKMPINTWIAEYARSLIFDIGVAFFFFSILYALLHWLPETWWFWAAGIYVVFSAFIRIMGTKILPLCCECRPLPDVVLEEAIQELAHKEHLKVEGVYQWMEASATQTSVMALAGFGSSRRIMLSRGLMRQCTHEEILALLAREISHWKHRDGVYHVVMEAVLAFWGMFTAHHCLHGAVAMLSGVEGVHDIAGLPILALCLFIFAFFVVMIPNAYARHREFAADAYAIRLSGSAEPLISSLNKLAQREIGAQSQALWIEYVLASSPSIDRRLSHARKVEQNL